MAKKTVIKRHAKLAPLSVEFQKAVALEDRAMSGESQDDLLGLEGVDNGVIDADTTSTHEAALKSFGESIPKGTDSILLNTFLEKLASTNKTTIEAVQVEAAKEPAKFWKIFAAWVKQQKAKPVVEEPLSDPCPNTGDNYKKSYCDGCPTRKGCPAWDA
jgi:hypothetical protein